jgi:hypothetical protein
MRNLNEVMIAVHAMFMASDNALDAGAFSF